MYDIECLKFGGLHQCIQCSVQTLEGTDRAHQRRHRQSTIQSVPQNGDQRRFGLSPISHIIKKQPPLHQTR